MNYIVDFLHTRAGVELGIVEVIDDALDLVDRAVPALVVRHCILLGLDFRAALHIHLKVTTDEELARHLGGLKWVELIFWGDCGRVEAVLCGFESVKETSRWCVGNPKQKLLERVWSGGGAQ